MQNHKHCAWLLGSKRDWQATYALAPKQLDVPETNGCAIRCVAKVGFPW